MIRIIHPTGNHRATALKVWQQSETLNTLRNYLKRKRFFRLVINPHGMSVMELMVAICITAILAAVAIPSYITYVQQARVISLILPRLYLIETNISLFYARNNKLPGSPEVAEILKDIDTEKLDIALANGSIAMTIKAKARGSKLHILDGKVLVASPALARDRIIGWHLSGELADRLKIHY
jgi:prepilin-type N-terminal cleavage/methylation domain-containing protein